MRKSDQTVTDIRGRHGHITEASDDDDGDDDDCGGDDDQG